MSAYAKGRSSAQMATARPLGKFEGMSRPLPAIQASSSSTYREYRDVLGMQSQPAAFDMVRFMETYKKSVDSFNSYGLVKRPETAYQIGSQKNF